MSAPFSYYSKAAQMTADLKRVLHANRAKNPRAFKPHMHAGTSQPDRQVIHHEPVKIDVMSPRRRHEFAYSTPKSFSL